MHNLLLEWAGVTRGCNTNISLTLTEVEYIAETSKLLMGLHCRQYFCGILSLRIWYLTLKLPQPRTLAGTVLNFNENKSVDLFYFDYMETLDMKTTCSKLT